MDPLTHCLVGGMAAKTLGTSKRRFWVMFLLGGAPDLDIIFNHLPGWAWAIQHRGLSHSVLGVLLQVFLYAWLLRKWDTGPMRIRMAHYSLPVFAHVLCDYLTAFGVPWFAPFSFREYSADLMVGLTLIPMFIMGVGLVWAYLKGHYGWHGTRHIWAGWMLYIFMAVSGKAYAAKLVAADGAIALPSTASPFQWAVVRPDQVSQSYQRYEVDLFRGRRLSQTPVAMPGKEFPIQASLVNRDVREFLRANRWPVARVQPTKTGWNVEWGNLLFSTRGMVRGKVRVHVAANGDVTSSERIFGFWNPASDDVPLPAIAS